VRLVFERRVQQRQELEEILKTRTFPSSDGEKVKVSEDRDIGFMVYGAKEDIKGVIVYIHGTPGSRFFITKAQEEAARVRGLQVILFERPGFGLSTFQKDRTLLSFAEDIKIALEKLNLIPKKDEKEEQKQDGQEEVVNEKRFPKIAILGYSAGGGYACACAYAFGKLLSNLTLVCSPSPPEAPDVTAGMTLFNKFAYWLSQNWEWALKKAVRMEANEISKNPIKKIFESLVGSSNGDDSCFLMNGEIETAFVLSAKEQYSNPDGAEAEAQDYWLFSHSWGFALDKIEIGQLEDNSKPTTVVWSGLQDKSVVPSMGKYLGSSIKNSALKELEEKGHLFIFECWEEILDQIIQNF